MSARKLDTAARRQQIAQAALAIVAEQGLRGLSMAALARRVGLVPSAIYRHFGGKDDVIDAILDVIREKLHGNLADVCEQKADPLARVTELVLRHARLIHENQAIPRMLFSEDFYVGRPERKRKFFRIIRGYLSRVGELFAEGQQAGRIRADVQPETLALMLLGTFQPAGILWFASDGHYNVERHTKRAWRVLCEAIETG